MRSVTTLVQNLPTVTEEIRERTTPLSSFSIYECKPGSVRMSQHPHQIGEEIPSCLDPRSSQYSEQCLFSFLTDVFSKDPKAFKEWSYGLDYGMSQEESQHDSRFSYSDASSCGSRHQSFSETYPSMFHSFSSQSSESSSPRQFNTYLAEKDAASMPTLPYSEHVVHLRQERALKRRRHTYRDERAGYVVDVRPHRQAGASNFFSCQNINTVPRAQQKQAKQPNCHNATQIARQQQMSQPKQAKQPNCNNSSTQIARQQQVSQPKQAKQPNCNNSTQIIARQQQVRQPNQTYLANVHAYSTNSTKRPGRWVPEDVPPEERAVPMYLPSSYRPNDPQSAFQGGVIKPIPRRRVVTARPNVVAPTTPPITPPMNNDNSQLVSLARTESPVESPGIPAGPAAVAPVDQETANKQTARPGMNKKEKELLCPFVGCNAKFRSQFSLQRHHKRHTGSRPFQCTWIYEEKNEICGVRFAEKSTLNRHMRSHTGQKPFPCNFPGCHKVFADRINWNRHSKKHQQEA
eukprot:g17503.t1